MSKVEKGTRAQFLQLLRSCYEELRADMRKQWHRDLPLEELLFDRWERARSLGFGEGTSIYHSSYVYGEVLVGRNTWIGPHTILDGSGRLLIGDHCSISAGVQIYTHDSVKWAVSGGKEPYERAETSIGNNCYIGPCAVVAKGVTIGDGCIVGAHSVVTKSLPSGIKAWGSPCRVQGEASPKSSCHSLDEQ